MSNVTWIKLSTDIFDVGKLPIIASMQDGATFELLWVKLLALAGQTNENGYLYVANSIPFDKKMLANRFKVKEKTMENALEIFKKFGMIEEENGVFLIKNWGKYQNVDGMEKVREQTRKRVSEYRERHRNANVTLHGNADVTLPETLPVTLGNAIEIDKEIDIEENKNKENITKEKEKDDWMDALEKKPEKKPKPTLNTVLSEHGVEGELLDAFNAFIAMRKAKKKPLTERALKMVITELNKLSKDTTTQVQIVNQSVLHGWDTVYALKEEKPWKPINSVEDVQKIQHRNPFAEMAQRGEGA